MNERLFLKQLQIQLRGLPAEEVEEVIQDYKSYFAEARDSGLTEEEAVVNLGHPLDIAQDIKNTKNANIPKDLNQARMWIIGIGLILFNLIIVLGPVLGIIGAYFGIIFSCIVFIISPLLVLINMAFYDGHLFDLFFSFALSGIGILVFPYLLRAAKIGQQLLQRYINWNMRLVKGEGL